MLHLHVNFVERVWDGYYKTSEESPSRVVVVGFAWNTEYALANDAIVITRQRSAAWATPMVEKHVNVPNIVTRTLVDFNDWSILLSDGEWFDLRKNFCNSRKMSVAKIANAWKFSRFVPTWEKENVIWVRGYTTTQKGSRGLKWSDEGLVLRKLSQGLWNEKCK